MVARKEGSRKEARRKDAKMTPAMAQFHRWKSEYPDELLFFRMGDFYELFYDDARVASEAVGIALTARQNDIPMAGVPVRSVDHYLKKLVTLGHRVAICEQIQDPKEADGVVERAVTRIVTAGTLTEEDLLDRAVPNFLAAAHVGKNERCGLAFLDLSTGEFVVETVSLQDATDALARHGAAEIVVSDDDGEGAWIAELKKAEIAPITRRPAWQFETRSALEAIREQYQVQGTDGFGIDDDSPVIPAAGAALRYLAETQKTDLGHIHPPRTESADDRLLLDRATRACLELTHTAREGRRDGSLLGVIDETTTAMGARRLREWLLAPLCDVDAIRARQAAVDELMNDGGKRGRVADHLKRIADIERLVTRVVTHRANGRDLVQLRDSLRALPPLTDELHQANANLLADVGERIDPLPELEDHLSGAVSDEPPATLKDGGIIRDGFHAELDELRAMNKDGRDYILRYQSTEIERTGIQNLKVGFNRVFGFYIEVTNSWKEHVPEDYVRKQTLKNAERYVTPELKEYEAKVLSADDRAKELEFELFCELRDRVTADLAPLQATAAALADTDALTSLATVAARHGYTRPEIDDDDRLEIEEGRHPVLAATLGASNFVPNDSRLGGDQRLGIVTGPNMAGKSTYIRQVALLQILAQIGSFVPARNARIGVVDRVFARVGASDDLARGHSTFMVEMTETANILNNATARSLVILDEVGRGTSTFDGMSLAWAISEHLIDPIGCRGLFATHYHQLIDLAARVKGVCNLTVSVKEWGDEIVFLHRIVEGGSDRSYGIHVARLAGIPKRVLDRASSILRDVEESSPDLCAPQSGKTRKPVAVQQNLFDPVPHELLKELGKLDPDQVTPMDALMRLRDWKERFGR